MQSAAYRPNIFESSLRCFNIPCSDEDPGTQCMEAHGDDARSRATKFLAGVRRYVISLVVTAALTKPPHPRLVHVRIRPPHGPLRLCLEKQEPLHFLFLHSSPNSKMHRTYSMRQSRAPTASQIQNPPPPISSTKTGRFFGKTNIGELLGLFNCKGPWSIKVELRPTDPSSIRTLDPRLEFATEQHETCPYSRMTLLTYT